LGDSDVFITYLNLERRNNWGVSVFQFRNDFLSFRDNTIFRFDRELFRGAEVFVSRPFSKFRRFELSMQGVAVDRRGFFTDDDDTRSGTGVEDIQDNQVYFAKPGMAFVTDNVLFGSTGPIAGARTRTSVAHSLGDLQFTTFTLDARKYINIRQRYSFAFRLLGVSSVGNTPQTFRIGGPYTLRGYPFEEFPGHKVGILNTEFRFPLIDQFRLGWPLPLELRGIRGVFFFDAGTAFDHARDFNAFDGSSGAFVRFEDIAASYGFGARINLGFLILRYDLAQRTDLSENLGSSRSTFAIGADF
jgi:outer membrane protein assembly factor BamA